MPFINKLRLYFLVILIISSILLVFIWYKDHSFNNSPLVQNTKQKLFQKEKRIRYLIKKYYGFDFDVPVKISNKMNNKKFGLAYYYNGQIVIYLNKKHFKESEFYMINDVLPHEYAHALMFKFGDFSNQSGGHGKKWQEICKKLEGISCTRYVNQMDIIIGKTNIFE